MVVLQQKGVLEPVIPQRSSVRWETGAAAWRTGVETHSIVRNTGLLSQWICNIVRYNRRIFPYSEIMYLYGLIYIL
jgi:hypothetical protein